MSIQTVQIEIITMIIINRKIHKYMTTEEFEKLVMCMRNAQRAYIRSKSPVALDILRKFEKDVDAELERRKQWRENHKPNEQLTLFA